jgi:hypothetical protein
MTHTKALHVGLVLAGVLAGIALSPFVNIHSCWGLLHYPSSPVSTNDLPTTDMLSATAQLLQQRQQRVGELMAAASNLVCSVTNNTDKAFKHVLVAIIACNPYLHAMTTMTVEHLVMGWQLLASTA